MKKVLRYPSLLRRGLNLWPPFWGAGIRIDTLSPDYRYARVSIKHRWWNKNAHRTQYGGSMFSSSDPIYPLMLMGFLGPQYLVWDRAGNITYLKPGRTALTAEFRLTDEKLEEIRRETEDGEKYFPTFRVNIVDAEGDVVAEIERTLYVRKKRQFRPEPVLEN